MKAKSPFVVALVALGCVIAGVAIVNHRRANSELAGNQSSRGAGPAVTPSTERISTPADDAQQTPIAPVVQTNSEAKPVEAAWRPDRQMDLTDPAVKEQWGRLALSFVGADPYADEVWIATINDPDLSPDARQNLIEDLNEDGLSDPRNPTVFDLPLIENRLWLIWQLAPYAMDGVNAAAFQEAYKDLIDMWLNLRGR